MKKKALILVLALLLLQIYVLFLPPSIGIQDDGTLYGILVQNGLYQLDEAANFNLVYGIMDGAGSSHNTVPIAPIKALTGLFSDIYFPVQAMAVFYMILFAVGVYLAFSKMEFSVPWLSWVMMAAAFVIFGDAAYTAYFHSLTYEGAALCYFVLLLGAVIHLALSEKPRLWEIILVAVAAFLFCATAKQLFFLAPLCALLLVRFAWARKEIWWRVIGIALALCMMIANTVLFTQEKVTNDPISRYHAVFYGALAGADEEEAKEGVRYFSLPENAAELAGTTYYENPDWSAEEKNALVADISYGTITRYYLSHPSALLSGVQTSARNAFFVRQDYLKYFQWDDQSKAEPYIWNTVKRMLPIQNFFLMAALWIAFLVTLIYNYKKSSHKRLYDAGIWLLSLSAVSFFLPGIFFGQAQISKTMFPFGMICDAVILFFIGWGIDTLMKRQKNIKEKYGVTQ